MPINAANNNKESSMDNCTDNYMGICTDNMSVVRDIQDMLDSQELVSCHPPIPDYSLPEIP
jgi:hypothetical protein